MQNIQGAPTIYLHVYSSRDLKRSQNAQKGEFSLSEAEYWWYIFVLNNVVGFGLSEMQGKFGKYFFLCNRSRGHLATFLFNINGAFNYYISPFLSKKDNIEVLMTEVLRLKNEIFWLL